MVPRIGTLFPVAPLRGAMRVVAWVRASQAVLFEAAVVPACVGTAAALAAGSPLDAASFLVIIGSLVAIQACAYLL